MICGASCKYSALRGGPGHSDAARRISDAIALTMVGASDPWTYVGKWMAFSLADGRVHDNYAVYPDKRTAVRHVTHELRYMFVKLHPGGMPICEAEIMLQFTRDAVSRGFRLTDPDAAHGGRDIIPRISTENITAQMRALTRGKN